MKLSQTLKTTKISSGKNMAGFGAFSDDNDVEQMRNNSYRELKGKVKLNSLISMYACVWVEDRWMGEFIQLARQKSHGLWILRVRLTIRAGANKICKTTIFAILSAHVHIQYFLFVILFFVGGGIKIRTTNFDICWIVSGRGLIWLALVHGMEVFPLVVTS